MPDEDSHLAVHARSQAHDSRLKIVGMTYLEFARLAQSLGDSSTGRAETCLKFGEGIRSC